MDNKIFVTASSGNIGSQIVKLLIAANADFTAGISQREEGKSFSYPTQIIDFADKNALSETFKGFDTLFLLVPMHPLMVDWAKNAVDAAKIAGIKHIVRSSGMGTNVQSPYKISKLQGTIDEYIKSSGCSFTITAPNNFMQNFISYHANDIKNGIVYMPTGHGNVSWIDVRDIAAVNAAILQNPSKFAGHTIDITGGESLSYADCLRIISEAIGKTVSFIDIPEQAAIDGMKQYHMPEFVIEVMSSLNALIKAGKAEAVGNSVSEITGKSPILFSEFVHENVNYWIK
ncbi:MAG: NmrA family NAD(P)-binding protein [Bacteroidota bacterium]